MDNIWIDRHAVPIGNFISLMKEDKDFIITDNLYNIPESINHIDNNNLLILASFTLLNIYGVQDEYGRIHVNGKDIERIKNWISTLKGRDLRLANAKYINVISIDYQSSEDYKNNFWKSVLK